MSEHEMTTRVAVIRVPGGEADDTLAVEEPLEIRVNDTPVSVTMRTPGDDFELAAGFLFTEAILSSPDQIESIRHWGSPNVVRVALRAGTPIDLNRLKRHFYATSSCGVCGKASIDTLRVQAAPLGRDFTVASSLLGNVPKLLREQQKAFEVTGGIHGAAALTRDGDVLDVREDIGRHNAVDKVIGALFMSGRRADVLAVSSRAGFEIVQKCAVARIPVLAAVGAPSSLAVELAREFQITLAAFVRDGRFNVYAGKERIV